MRLQNIMKMWNNENRSHYVCLLKFVDFISIDVK